METATMPSRQSVQGTELENQGQGDNGQKQSIGGMEQEMDYNSFKQGYGEKRWQPLTDSNNNNRNGLPEFGSEEKILNNDKDKDEPEGPVNPEIPDEGSQTPVPDPITF